MARQVAIVLFFFSLFSCAKDIEIPKYKTQNLIFILMDGPRFSETIGDVSNTTIPNIKSMLAEGTLIYNYRNAGITETISGCATLLTGFDESLSNDGLQIPTHPTLLQLFANDRRYKNSIQLIASKDKLEVLNYSVNTSFNYALAASDCGINGNGSGYRDDSTTHAHALYALNTNHSKITFVFYKQPDAEAHAGDSLAYIQAIKDCDTRIAELYSIATNSGFYKDKTTFVVTNDHGRHLSSPNGLGFQNHGDNCEGCRHIFLFIAGPDIKKGFISPQTRLQKDFAPTVLELFSIYHHTDGNVMTEIFQK